MYDERIERYRQGFNYLKGFNFPKNTRFKRYSKRKTNKDEIKSKRKQYRNTIEYQNKVLKKALEMAVEWYLTLYDDIDFDVCLNSFLEQAKKEIIEKGR